jgi:hypothetical protein
MIEEKKLEKVIEVIGKASFSSSHYQSNNLNKIFNNNLRLVVYYY